MVGGSFAWGEIDVVGRAGLVWCGGGRWFGLRFAEFDVWRFRFGFLGGFVLQNRCFGRGLLVFVARIAEVGVGNRWHGQHGVWPDVCG